MPRVPLLDPSDLEEPARSLVANHPINLYRTLAHNSGAFACFAEMGRWIRFDSTLDPRLREMVILAVGVLDDSEYEFSHHVKIGLDFGLSDEDVAAVVSQIRTGESPLAEDERLLLEVARQITEEHRIDDSSWARVLEWLGYSGLVELVVVTAHYSCVTRVLGALEIEVEPSYNAFLSALS